MHKMHKFCTGVGFHISLVGHECTRVGFVHAHLLGDVTMCTGLCESVCEEIICIYVVGEDSVLGVGVWAHL